MKELLHKYYVFTIVVIILTASLFYFGKSDSNVVSMIVGALIGLITAPKDTTYT